MKTSICALTILLATGISYAGDTSQRDVSTDPDQPALGATLLAGASSGTQLADEQRSGNRPVLLARAYPADDEQQGNGNAKGKGKGKGKGKAKGHNKDKDKEDSDSEQTKDAGNAQAQPATAQPAPISAPVPTSAAAPAQAAKPVSVAPATAATAHRSPAEVKTEVDRHLAGISALDKNAATSKARFAALARETGVPVATLEAQQKAQPVGTGGILIANEMAKATKKPASTFLKQRLQGRDWSQIAAENKFDLTPVLPKLQRLHETMQSVAAPKR